MSATIHHKIELVDIAKLVPYDKNAKIHNEAQVEKLAKSITEHGWDQPLVADGDYVLIKGHGRRLAALKLGLKKVPVIVRRDMTPEQVKAARLADNRVAMGDYDTELLQAELATLAEAGYDMSSMGFDEKELDFMTAELDALNVDAALTDLNQSVEEQTQKTEAAVAAVATREVPIATALGFKTVPGDAERDVSQFMATIEAHSGKSGVEAFIAFCRSVAATAA